MCLGMIHVQPQRSRKRVWKRELDWASSNTTVLSSFAVTDLTFSLKKLPADHWSSLISVSIVKTTSAALKGSPSSHATPLRRGISQVVKSALYFASPSASPLIISPLAKSTDQRGSFARVCMPRSRFFQPTHSLKLSGEPQRPV